MLSAPRASVFTQSAAPLVSPTVTELSTKVSQVDKDVRDLQKSFDQLRSDVGSATTSFRFSRTLTSAGTNIHTPSQSFRLDGANCVGEGTSREPSTTATSAVSVCESKPDTEIAPYFRRLSALEATCEDLRNILQDRLEEFRAELEVKLKHVNPSNFRTIEQNWDEPAPVDSTKQESPIAPGGDLSQTVASVYAILRKEVIQECGQLHSVIESKVQSLRSQFEEQSAKVERNVTILSRSEATNNWFSQRMAEIGQDVAKIRERDIASRSEVSELRSRLEVVVRECDELISKEQDRRADETATFLSSLKQDNSLSERVRSLENTCQQAIATPSVVVEASEGLRAELRQVVDPLREDVDCLKRATARGQRSDKELRDPAESNDPERRSSPHEVTMFHKRLSDLEAACPGPVERALSQEMQQTWPMVKGQVASVTQNVELLRNEYSIIQERINNLTDSVAHACASSIMKAEASLSKELVAMKNSNLATGASAVFIGSMPSSPRPEERQLKEVPQERRLETAIERLHGLSDEMRAERAMHASLSEKRIAASEAAVSADVKSVREMIAGTVVSRIAALESMMTRQLVSNKSSVAQSQAQSQVPMRVQANGTLASESHTGATLETSPIEMKASRTLSRLVGATGPSTQPSLQSVMSAARCSVSPKQVSGISASTRTFSRDEGGMNVSKPKTGSLVLPCRHEGSQLNRATVFVRAPTQSPRLVEARDLVSPFIQCRDTSPSYTPCRVPALSGVTTLRSSKAPSPVRQMSRQ